MADTETTEAEAPAEQTEDRLDRVENKLDALIDTVSKILPGSHAEAEQQTEDRLDRGSDFEDRVRAEIEKGKKEEAAKAEREQAENAHKAEHEAMARMRENPPAPPRLRRTKMLGWGDGRK